MSALALGNGDDHPEAAEKHLSDAKHLLSAGRADGAAYLSGYVVECSIKSIIVLETSGALVSGHSLSGLARQVAHLALVAGSKAARYFGPATQAVPNTAISRWKPELRYRAPGMNAAMAATWYGEAEAIFWETVAQMMVDGVL